MGLDVLRELWADLERSQHDVAAKAAEADPEKHRNTKFLKAGVRASDYCRYAVGRDKRKAAVYWCFMNGPNVAGFYLSWRERVTGKTLKRTHCHGWKTKGRAETEALRRCRAERKKKAPSR